MSITHQPHAGVAPPVFMRHGTADDEHSYVWGADTAAGLRNRGCNVDFAGTAGAVHGIEREWCDALLEWVVARVDAMGGGGLFMRRH